MKDNKNSNEKNTTKVRKRKKILVENNKSNKVKSIITSRKKANDKTTFNLIEVIIIMIITAVFGVLVGSFVSYFRGDSSNYESDLEYAEFVNVYNEITNEYYGNINKDKLLEAGIKGMVDYLNDPYSSYLDYNVTDDFNMELEGEYFGIGLTITADEKGLIINEVFENSPSYNAGFIVGDRILKINEKSVGADDLDNIYNIINNKEESSINITILRNNVEMILSLISGKVVIPSVHYNVVESTKIGYIKIDIFAKNTPEQFNNAMRELKKNNIKSLVIDVRNNSGGYLSSAEKIISYFVDKGDVLYQLDTKGVVEKVINHSEKIYDYDIVVLINKNSASASEILTASLKDNINAVTVGEKSFGKGTVQKAIQLSSGAMIKYTIQEWLTPNGNKINNVGITADYNVLNNEQEDLQLKQAIELLNDK